MITSEIPKLKYFHHFDQSELNPSFHRKYFVNDIGDRITINQDEIEKMSTISVTTSVTKMREFSSTESSLKRAR